MSKSCDQADEQRWPNGQMAKKHEKTLSVLNPNCLPLHHSNNIKTTLITPSVDKSVE